MNAPFQARVYLPHPPRGDRIEMVQVHRRRKEIRNRLTRAEGHIRGIIKMIDEDRSCPDLLLQIAAVRAALNKVGVIVLEDHLESCLTEAVKAGEIEPQLMELKEALAKYL